MAKINSTSIDALLGAECKVSKNGKLTRYEAVLQHDPFEILDKFYEQFGECKSSIYDTQTRLLFEINGEYHGILISQPRV